LKGEQLLSKNFYSQALWNFETIKDNIKHAKNVVLSSVGSQKGNTELPVREHFEK
jgi:hypothetical protein